ncbi:TetR family transcriptional regulator [Mycolicibacterium peregrinum]|uniref:TetR/AcrR family transcriptional regulator n=1 Tax=Mycolicibacterium peregrinum TaxID=43304 RepID=UPI0007EA7D22|nr:TetR/AcrR family transcriptional regulator [Mycolicibacterium peregrinum]OBF37499.1 TetR family transcriptional regulator [Mycolicibacterium peregrinum]
MAEVTASAGARLRSRRTRLEADERREQIVAAAQHLFAQRPYDQVSTGEIAAAAGTTRTNVLYYFKTKRDLFLEIVERFSRIPNDLATPEVHLDVHDRVRMVFERWLDGVERNRSTYLTMVNASSSSDPKVSGALRDSMWIWEQNLLRIVALDLDDPSNHAMVRSFQALVADATMAWLESGQLDKAQVLVLLTNCLIAVGHSASAEK